MHCSWAHPAVPDGHVVWGIKLGQSFPGMRYSPLRDLLPLLLPSKVEIPKLIEFLSAGSGKKGGKLLSISQGIHL